MAKTKRSLREARDGKNRSRVESDCSSPSLASGSINDRSSCSRDESADGNVRRSTRSTKGVPSRRVQQENEESGSQSLLERVVRGSRSKSLSPEKEEKDYSPANSEITPMIVTEAALRAFESSVGMEKRSSPESGDSSSFPNPPEKPKRTWPKQYRKLERFDGVEHPPCTNCNGKVRPQKGGINSRNEYWWRCLNKTCRRWYGRTAQRPDVERSRRQSAAKQRMKRERAREDSMRETERVDDEETKVFRKLRRQSRQRRGDRRQADSSSDSWQPDEEEYQALIHDVTKLPTTRDDDWHRAEPVLPPPPIERMHVYRPPSWSDNKTQLRIVNITIPCPEQSVYVKLL